MNTQTYTWLPERHLGVAATLAHADELIAQVAEILYGYQTQPDGILRLQEEVGVTRSRTVVTGIEPIPRKVPLLVADALVALRNAIEHTLFAEVEFRDGELDETAARPPPSPDLPERAAARGPKRQAQPGGEPPPAGRLVLLVARDCGARVERPTLLKSDTYAPVTIRASWPGLPGQ